MHANHASYLTTLLHAMPCAGRGVAGVALRVLPPCCCRGARRATGRAAAAARALHPAARGAAGGALRFEGRARAAPLLLFSQLLASLPALTGAPCATFGAHRVDLRPALATLLLGSTCVWPRLCALPVLDLIFPGLAPPYQTRFQTPGPFGPALCPISQCHDSQLYPFPNPRPRTGTSRGWCWTCSKGRTARW